MLRSATRVLNHYTLKTKFTVIGAAIALVLAVPLLHVSAVKLCQIGETGRELEGVAVSQPLRATLQQVLALRAVQIKGDSAALGKVQQSLDKSVKELDEAVADYDEKSTEEQWKALKPALLALKGSQASTSEGAKAYRDATTQLMRLLSLVADSSKLTLDPELDSYALAQNSTQLLPGLLQHTLELSGPAPGQKAQADEGLGNAFGDAMPADAPPPEAEPAAETPPPAEAAPAASAAAAPVASVAVASPAEAAPAEAEPPAVAPVSAGAALIYQSLSRLEDKHAAVMSNLERVITANPQLKEALQPARREYSLAFDDYLETLRQLLEKPEQPIVDAESSLHDKLFKLYDANLQHLQAKLEERRGDQMSGLFWEWVFIAVLAALLFLLFRAIHGSLLASVRRMSEGLDQIATGNLLTTIELDAHDELQQMARRINTMASELRELLGVAQGSSRSLFEQVEVLHQSSRQVQNSTAEQSSAAASMASSIGELSFSISQIASQAQHGSEVSSKTAAISEESGAVIHRMAQEMSTISESVRTTATAIESLGEHSDKISSVVQVIKEVAGQTNLLALNAAIEAARAGEQGRGFAVVADEVRKLAERTTRSTQEIAEIIESIQDATMNAILSMGSVVSRVNEGVELANNAGSAVTQIRTQGEATQAMVNDISAALQEHAAAGQQLAEAMQNSASLSVNSSQIAQNTAQTAEQMYELATRIQETVGRFRIE